MLHPTLESLLFLKIARNTVCENIDSSDIEEKTDLKNYIQNEASDYEIIHLITLDEMPEVKFDSEMESVVWEHMKRGIVANFDYVSEGTDVDAINNIIFEMGPVSGLGYSSAKPIFEFAKAQGLLEASVLTEKENTWSRQTPQAKANAQKAAMLRAEKEGSAKQTAKNKALYGSKENRTASEMQRKKASVATTNKIVKQRKEAQAAADRKERAGWESQNTKKALANAVDDTYDLDAGTGTKPGMSRNAKIAAGVGGTALAVAGAYGAYKLYQKWKAKRAAAKTEKEKAAATEQMAKAKAKMKKK